MRFVSDMNLMLFEKNQRIKISDWDGALFIVNEMSAADMNPVGTPGFCAPEVRATCILDMPVTAYGMCLFSSLYYGGEKS